LSPAPDSARKAVLDQPLLVRLQYGVGCLLRRDVFPDPQGDPSRLKQFLIGVAVPGLVALDLPVPPLRIRSRWREVLGTTVPEATVDIHGEPGAREGDVNPSPAIARDVHLHPVAETTRMQFVAKRQLGSSVFAGKHSHLG
jgi:hypothetical protein